MLVHWGKVRHPRLVPQGFRAMTHRLARRVADSCSPLVVGASSALLGLVLCGAANGGEDRSSVTEETAPAAASHQEALRAKLEADLSGAVLVGRFTVTGEQAEPAAERYELSAVKHLGKDQWLFQARIRYGQHDVKLPLTLPVRWAGDTPVITVDNFGFPGLGVYTARVMIYRDHYAGFWTGVDHGGHLFGVVERPPSE